ncbi:hypothetical protein F7725_028126 [Dissostichus mawsoni]|uniref:Uncharacterized protein n=1 Tax=Dissostichus mawsoni TaxID=36200 RepID=A0A7J5XH83_DISMA|nr:hypothetical protein F7725_028126 [Dissostichus mawsoni]
MMKRMMRARVQIYSQPPAFMMRDRELSWWKNQLNWHIQVQGKSKRWINESLLETLYTSKGSPQGGVLSLFLFILHTDEFHKKRVERESDMSSSSPLLLCLEAYIKAKTCQLFHSTMSGCISMALWKLFQRRSPGGAPPGMEMESLFSLVEETLGVFTEAQPVLNEPSQVVDVTQPGFPFSVPMSSRLSLQRKSKDLLRPRSQIMSSSCLQCQNEELLETPAP